MGFGSGNTVRLKLPSFRSNLLQDMQAVAEGRLGPQSNAQLINQKSNIMTNLTYITRNGKLVASVGDTIVGEPDIVGYPDEYELGGK